MIENSKIAIIGISALVSQVSLLHGYNKVKSQTLTLFLHKNEYEKMSKAINPYGDGKACQKIVDFLKDEI